MDESDDGRDPETPPRKILPINRNASGRNHQKMRDMLAAAQGPVTSLDGYKPSSLDDARDATARALGEVLLQKRNLRRFRGLLRSKNDKVALAAFELAIQHILSVAKPGTGSDKPTQVIVNNLVARPPDPPPPTIEVH